ALWFSKGWWVSRTPGSRPTHSRTSVRLPPLPKAQGYGNRWQQNVTTGSGPNPSYTFDANNRIRERILADLLQSCCRRIDTLAINALAQRAAVSAAHSRANETPRISSRQARRAHNAARQS